MNQSPFTPGATVSATPTTTQALALGVGSGALGTPQVVISLGGASPAVAFIKFGTSAAVTAATTDFPILPNTTVCLTPPAGSTHVAMVGTAGTFWLTIGHGVLG